MKTKILFSAYTDYPNPNSGGPNKIIYEILAQLDFSKFTARYISKHLDVVINSREEFDNIYNSLSSQKKLSISLYNKCRLFRKIVGMPAYLAYHYKKNNKYFAAKNILDFKPDIIHSHDPRSHYYFSSYPCKKILTIHSKGMIVNDMMNSVKVTPVLKKHFEIFRKNEIISVKESNLVTFPSKYAKSLYLKESSLQDRNMEVIYNGVNIPQSESNVVDPFLNYLIDNKDFDITICNVAEHIRVKNINKIIETVDILKNKYKKKVRFLNIGKGVETDNLKRLIGSKGLKNEIILHPGLPNDVLLNVISHYMYYISASEKVIFDMIILEAMAKGLTVVASSSGGNTEIIKDGFNGYLFDEISPAVIAETIIDADISKVKDKSIKTVTYFTSQKMIHNYLTLYQNLLNEKKA